MAIVKLDPKKFGLALGILLGACLLVWAWVSAVTGFWNGTLALMARVYWGYSATPLGGIVGLIWGFVEGFVGGYIFAAIYNWIK